MDDLNKELVGKKGIDKQCIKIYKEAKGAFKDQQERTNRNMDYWDIYNCNLNHNQAYESSLSRLYIPIAHEAIEARVTRFTNQMFPDNGRFVEVVTTDGTYPYAHTALLENYVRKAKLRTEVMPALMRNGDIEGQYSVYVSWKKETRNVRYKSTEKAEIDDFDVMLDELDDIETMNAEALDEGHPYVEVISDCDMVIFPVTAQSVEDALEIRGHVTRLMRMTKGKVQKMIDDGTFDKKRGKSLLDNFDADNGEGGDGRQNATDKQVTAAGIRRNGAVAVANVYQTWAKIKIGNKRRLCVIYYGGDDLVLSVRLNPYWCDRCPIISVPITKTSNICKGVSKVAPVADLQYQANDAANLGMASGMYSMQPIVMTDPEKNPRIGTMLMNIGAIWQTSPNDTQVVSFPDLYQSAFQIIDWCKGEIFQALGVNPSMVTSGGAYRKPTQAEVANEQQVDILTTADAVTIIEEGILTPILERFFDYDKQFRTSEVTVRAFGDMGIRASMEVIEPIQDNNRYTFRWLGVEAARNAQKVQQQISAVNVIRGIPPQLLPGRKLNLVPAIEALSENAFGPRLAPMIFEDMSKKLALSPELENELFLQGFDMPVNELDDDIAHIQSHIAELNNDPTGYLTYHIENHKAQLMQKQQEVSMGMAQANPSGAPAGGASMPQAGSSPAGPSNMKQPPGAVHPDEMQDPSMMPRERPI